MRQLCDPKEDRKRSVNGQPKRSHACSHVKKYRLPLPEIIMNHGLVLRDPI